MVESKRPDQRAEAQELLIRCEEVVKNPLVVSVTGPPGVGKSTFIEAIGLALVEQGHRVAVLSVDPASQMSGGSILGDKTRMAMLGRSAQAYIRPSSNNNQYGGITTVSRETGMLCAAAGYDHVIFETVGIGQSESDVRFIADMVILLLQPGSGDELQGYKRGVLEQAHLLVVNKADGEQQQLAEHTRLSFETNRMMVDQIWQQRILVASALSGYGIPEVMNALSEFGQLDLVELRLAREQDWFRWRTEDLIRSKVAEMLAPEIKSLLQDMEKGTLSPTQALFRFDELLHERLD